MFKNQRQYLTIRVGRLPFSNHSSELFLTRCSYGFLEIRDSQTALGCVEPYSDIVIK